MKEKLSINLEEITKKRYPVQLAGMIIGKKKYYCKWCCKRIEGFKDKLSVQEYRISGLCQECQDKTFKS